MLTKYIFIYLFIIFFNKQQCSRAPECNGLDLQSFLIQPIQRIPRYNLLLEVTYIFLILLVVFINMQDLRKHTPKDHPDYSDLENSLAKIKGIAGFLNENARYFIY